MLLFISSAARGHVYNTNSGHPVVMKSKSDSALIGLQGSSKLWIGKDYTNFIVKDFTDLESPFTGKSQSGIALSLKIYWNLYLVCDR